MTIVIGMVGSSLRETGVHLHLSQTVAWGEIQSDSESCQPALLDILNSMYACTEDGLYTDSCCYWTGFQQGHQCRL